jgi:hypothetical protein
MNDTIQYVIDDGRPTRHYYYVCPGCLGQTGNMVLLEKEHTPTPEQLKQAGYGIFEIIGHEMFGCTCGRELTWFDMVCMELVA